MVKIFGGWLTMKKGFIIALFLICVIVVAGCVAQPYSAKNKTQKEIDLVKELEEIEKKLNTTDSAPGDEVPSQEDADTSPTETNESSSEEDVAADVSETVDTSKLQRIELQDTGLVNLRVDTEDSDKDNVTYTFSPPLNAQGKWQTNYADAGEYI